MTKKDKELYEDDRPIGYDGEEVIVTAILIIGIAFLLIMLIATSVKSATKHDSDPGAEVEFRVEQLLEKEDTDD